MVLGADIPMPYKHEPCKISSELLKQYIGKWVGNIYDIPLPIEIFIKDNKLYRKIEGQSDVELIPESDSKFFYGDGQDKQFEFVHNKNGEVTKGWFISSGVKFQRDKIKKIAANRTVGSG